MEGGKGEREGRRVEVEGGEEKTDESLAVFLARSPHSLSFFFSFHDDDMHHRHISKKQSARSNDPYSARPGGAGGATTGVNVDDPANQSLARGPAAAAAAAIASAAVIATPEAAYCELCDVSRRIFLVE